MAELAYVNGTFCEIASAKVSIEDRGFQFADGVYEVVVSYGGKPFRLSEHIERLKRSLDAIDLSVDLERIGLAYIVQEGINRAGFDPAMVYLQITRGPQSRAFAYGSAPAPTVVATFKAKPIIGASEREAGISVVTVEDFRWTRCEIKSVALLPAVLAKNRALGDGFDDAVFVASSGEVREATSANVFAVIDGVLITPTMSSRILQGVTRGYVLECAQRAEVRAEQGALTVSALESATEAFISSTTADVMPITKVNGKTIGSGRMGPVTQTLYDAYVAGLPIA